jgi:hypothetical protein
MATQNISWSGILFVWIGLAMAGAVLGVGLSWSLVRARAVGQIEVD